MSSQLAVQPAAPSARPVHLVLALVKASAAVFAFSAVGLAGCMVSRPPKAEWVRNWGGIVSAAAITAVMSAEAALVAVARQII